VIWVTVVWSPSSAIAAVVGGFALGALILWKQSPTRPKFRAGITLLVGTVFYTGQTVATVMTEPTTDASIAPRLTSRFLLWVLFSAAVGVGCWVSGRRWHRQQVKDRRDRALASAVPSESPVELP
jgi:hypothetical protein